MQYPPRGTGWYQGYGISGSYSTDITRGLETRLSNAYGMAKAACRIHETGDYQDFSIWVMN